MIKKLQKIKYNSGVTLIELLVVIFIFVILTGITIFSYGEFNSSLSIQNLADDIALSVRRAQGYAIGVRGANDVFTNGYGVHFALGSNTQGYGGSRTSFILFTDVASSSPGYSNDANTCGNTPDINNECNEMLNIVGGNQIYSITLTVNNSPFSVSSTGSIDVIFKRPNPEPTFCYKASAGGSICNEGSAISAVKIKILNTANTENYKVVTISSNGQISVYGN